LLCLSQFESLFMQRIAVTGSSGYYGSRLIRYIRSIAPHVEVLGLDVAPPRAPADLPFAKVDVRSPELRRILTEFRPDTIIHLAFIVNPIHDEGRMHDINVNGSRNVFEAVHEIGPDRFMLASSATVFGAFPDNPLPIDDRWPAQGGQGFQYADDKSLLETMIADFADRHPAMAVSWVRPAIIYGPGVDNYLSHMLLRHPMVVLPDGCNLPQQFVHEDDVVAATWRILERDGRGPYNIAPADWIHLTDIARETGRRTISLPLWVMMVACRVCWGLRIPFIPMPPAAMLYVRHTWVLAPNRLCGELGYQFQYNSLETLRELLRSQGMLAAGPKPSLPPSTPGRLKRAG
jgi:UDP-glucose 4-epimerase